MGFPYLSRFRDALAGLKREGRYRVFTDIVRARGDYPNADFYTQGARRPVTVWCSNDYLGMGQHPKVLAAMHEAIDTTGAGSGGTRNISGTTHYHVELEAELADLHGKEAALLFTSGFVSNDTTLATLAKILPGLIVFSDDLQSRLDDRRHPSWRRREAHLPAQRHGRSGSAAARRRTVRAQADRVRIRLFDGRRFREGRGDLRSRGEIRRAHLYRRSPRRGALRRARCRRRGARRPDARASTSSKARSPRLSA